MALAEAAWKRDTVRTERPAKLTVFHTVGDPPRNSITHIDIDHRLPVIDIVAESNTSRDATADATRGD